MSRIKLFFSLFLLLAINNGCIESEKIILQNPAPKVQLTKLLNEKQDVESLLSGEKTIVLEFWATWCAPCIKAVPHMNQLVAEFEDRDDVVFLSITTEKDETKVRNFMKKHNMKCTVGLDDDSQTEQAYQVDELPTLFLINKDGIVKWRGHPELLTKEMLENLIYTRELSS